VRFGSRGLSCLGVNVTSFVNIMQLCRDGMATTGGNPSE